MPYAEDDDDDFEHGPEWDEEQEAPDAQDADWNLDPAVKDCPWCGQEISEDASRCPHCGEYLSDEDAPPAKKPLWIILGVALLILILLSWMFWQ